LFVSFLPPFGTRKMAAPYLWVLYKQISHFSPDEVVFIGTEEYFQDPAIFIASGRKDISQQAQEYCEFRIPSYGDMMKYRRYFIQTDTFQDFEVEGLSNIEIVSQLMTNRFEKFEKEITRILNLLIGQNTVEALLTWCNIMSLSAVAASKDIPVIHNELGAFRKPCYHATAYFDFKGVNGNTEAAFRFNRFLNETTKHSVPILSKEELRALYLLKPVDVESKLQAFEIGIPLQVEDDTNIIAFSQGWDNQLLIKNVSAIYGRKRTLIRRHPAGLYKYDETHGVMDNSPDSISFLHRCKRIATINSSVGLEAMLFDHETYILGDSPFAFAAENKLGSLSSTPNLERRLLILNFLLFGYLIPYEYLYEPEYFRWRLGRPPETEIYEFNLRYFRERDLLIQNRDHHRFLKDTQSLIGLLKFQMRKQNEYTWRIADLENCIRNMQNTLSWRLTEPLRFIGKLVGWRKDR
jgi:hypothetical protein